MSTKAPSIAVLQQKRIVELTEAWNRCKADNARLERDLEINRLAAASVHKTASDYAARISHLESLLREVLEHNTPSLELRERIRAAVGEMQTVER